MTSSTAGRRPCTRATSTPCWPTRDDIVMFDVPPRTTASAGCAAYRDTWPPFFEWQAQGAVFEID